MNEQAEVSVSIVGFVARHQPDIIEFELRDAFGKAWLFHDKVPVVTELDLEEDSTYPVPATLCCTIRSRYVDGTGRKLAVIDTEHPFGVDELSGEHVFTIREDQLSCRKFRGVPFGQAIRLPTYDLIDLKGEPAELWFNSQRVAARIGSPKGGVWAYAILPDDRLVAIGLEHREPAEAVLHAGRIFIGFDTCLATFSYPDLLPVFCRNDLYPRFNEFVHVDDRQIILANELGFAGVALDGTVGWEKLFDDYIASYEMHSAKIVGVFSDGARFEFPIPDAL